MQLHLLLVTNFSHNLRIRFYMVNDLHRKLEVLFSSACTVVTVMFLRDCWWTKLVGGLPLFLERLEEDSDWNRGEEDTLICT